ncbi:MAG: hypothetical protein ABSG83_19865 [Roseiarcus sp.]|jgi:hypothetical protein
MDKTEELARIIAAAVTGLDPDVKFVFGEPLGFEVLRGYAVPAAEFVNPLWAAFRYAAQRAIEAGFDRPGAAEPVELDPAPESYVQTSLFDQQESSHAPSQDDDWRSRMGLA